MATITTAEAEDLLKVCAEVRDLRAVILSADLSQFLLECVEYFDGRADCEIDSDGYHPNPEMRLLQAARLAMAAVDKVAK